MIDLDSAFGQQAGSDSSDRSSTIPGPGDVRRAAMDLLARREHTRKELARKLSKKFRAVPEIVEEELDKLKAEGLQSDARLAEVFIRSRVSRGQGPVKIKMELRARGWTMKPLAWHLRLVKLTGLRWLRRSQENDSVNLRLQISRKGPGEADSYSSAALISTILVR